MEWAALGLFCAGGLDAGDGRVRFAPAGAWGALAWFGARWRVGEEPSPPPSPTRVEGCSRTRGVARAGEGVGGWCAMGLYLPWLGARWCRAGAHCGREIVFGVLETGGNSGKFLGRGGARE